MLLDRAVINSGPLVALPLAGRLDLLPALFGEFWIPEPVFHEVALAGVGRPGAGALADARWAAHVCPAPTPDPLLVAETEGLDLILRSIGEAEPAQPGAGSGACRRSGQPMHLGEVRQLLGQAHLRVEATFFG